MQSPVAEDARVLLTVAEMGEEVVDLPDVSYALQVKLRVPLGMPAVLYEILYGAVVSVPRSSEPSHQNSTLVTPTSSLAVPVKVAVPLRLAPVVGVVRVTPVGG
jgi:hypothetical protein